MSEIRMPESLLDIVHKPWGWYTNLFESKYALVKVLIIKPGEETSLQFHCGRSETWIVITGTPSIRTTNKVGTLSQEVLSPGDRREIEAYSAHQILNLTEKPVEILELWTGELLDENDIERIQDKYLRCVV